MIDHLRIAVSNLQRSRTFYCGALAPLGYRFVTAGNESLGFGMIKSPRRRLSRDPGGDFY